MYVIGIDPGNTGAVAIWHGDGWLIHDTPIMQVKSGKRLKNVPDAHEMANILAPYAGKDTHAYLEKVNAMPGQGVTSMFNFGMGYGMWQGILAALRIPFTLVHPTKWKKKLMSGMSKEKDAARVRAKQLFPYLSDQLTRKKDVGRADAALIGEFGRRELQA